MTGAVMAAAMGQSAGGGGGGGFTATATSPQSGTGSTFTITTEGSSVVTPSGGTAPYTYAWRDYLNDAYYNPDGIGILTPTGSSTAFRRSGCVSGETYVADFECVVTDAVSATATTGAVSVSISRT